MNDSTARVVVFPRSSESSWATSIETPQPKTRRAETSSAPSMRSPQPRLPLIALCDEPTKSQVLRRAIDTLSRLDTDQIQIVEIVIAAIARGERK